MVQHLIRVCNRYLTMKNSENIFHASEIRAVFWSGKGLRTSCETLRKWDRLVKRLAQKWAILRGYLACCIELPYPVWILQSLNRRRDHHRAAPLSLLTLAAYQPPWTRTKWKILCNNLWSRSVKKRKQLRNRMRWPLTRWKFRKTFWHTYSRLKIHRPRRKNKESILVRVHSILVSIIGHQELYCPAAF